MVGVEDDLHEEISKLKNKLRAVKRRCNDARYFYRKYIRSGFEQTDFNGFLAGIEYLIGDIGE